MLDDILHDADTDALRAFNANIHDDKRIDACVLTVGYGVVHTRKRQALQSRKGIGRWPFAIQRGPRQMKCGAENSGLHDGSASFSGSDLRRGTALYRLQENL